MTEVEVVTYPDGVREFLFGMDDPSLMVFDTGILLKWVNQWGVLCNSPVLTWQEINPPCE